MGKRILLGNVKGPQGDKGSKGDPGPKGPRGSRWATGTAINGTITTPTSYSTGIADSTVNDHYFNPKTGHIYRCYVAGDESTAKWVWVGNLSSLNGTETVFVNKDVPDAFKPLPFFTNNTLNACAYDNRVFIAVGDAGTILYSSDGFEWTEITIAGVAKFTAAVFAGDKFVIFGNDIDGKCCAYYSFDGSNWIKEAGELFSTKKIITVLSYVNGKLIAAGYSSTDISTNTIYYSDNGYEWHAGTIMYDTTHYVFSDMTDLTPKGVAYGNGKFVMTTFLTSKSEEMGDFVLISTDGINWSLESARIQPILLHNTYAISNVMFSKTNNKFVAIAFMSEHDIVRTVTAMSTDGINWGVEMNPILSLEISESNHLIYANDLFLFITPGSCMCSKDVMKKTKFSDGITVNAITAGNNLCIAVGKNGAMYYSSLADAKMLNDVVNSLINEDSELADQIKSLQTQYNEDIPSLSADISSLSTDMSEVKKVLDKHYYATDEKIVGKLSDGSTLYEKTFMDVLANTDSLNEYADNPSYFYRSTRTDTVDLSDLNISKIVSVEGTLEASGGIVCRIGDIIGSYFGDCGNGPATEVYELKYSSFFIGANNANIYVRLWQQILSSCNFTIRYTKTTG